MTQYSFPWNDVNGDRLYDAEDFMRFFAAFLKTGVVMSFKDGLRVRSAQNGMNIQVGAGSAVIDGGSYLNDEAIAIQVNVASSIQERLDSVVLRMDTNARATQLFYKAGDTTVARNDTVYELQLATISVKTNATQITDADITDMRSDSTVCGWSTPFDNINVDGIVDQYKGIFEQADVEFQNWFKNLKNQLDDNQAANLQNQIDGLVDSKANSADVVHNSGDETIAGMKTFTDPTKTSSLEADTIKVSGGISSKIYETKYATPSFEAQYFRVGNMVTMTTHTIIGIAQTTSYPIPVGFRPYNNGANPIYEQVFSSGATAILRSSNATWQPRTSSGIGAGLYATTTYPTNDPFPTS
jgi:hypothetical protein